MDIKKVILKDKNTALMINDPDEDAILNRAANALNKGVKVILFYNKTLSDKQNIKIARKLRQLCSLFGALFIILSRSDIANLVDSDGICLFEYDLDFSDIRKIVHNNDKLFGMYVYSRENIITAKENNLDFVILEQNADIALASALDNIDEIKKIKLIRNI